MNMEVFDKFINVAKENNFAQNFIKELTNCIKNTDRREQNMDSEIENEKNYREENVYYQVVDKSENGVYLQNTKNNVIFEETDIPKELQDELENDFVLQYRNGKYILESELTDEFFNSLININEFKQIQNKFENESNISEINPDTRFNVLVREKEYSKLGYDNGKLIDVPNALLPYFIYDETILKYENGKFEIDIN